MEKTDYNEMFKFLNQFIREIKLDFYKFDLLCGYLKIPNEVKTFAKKILIKQKNRFNNLKTRKKFLFYIASFFVSYVMIHNDYAEFESNINNLIIHFNNNPFFINRYVDLNRILLIIRSKGYHPYLVNESLTPDEMEEYITIMYRIEIKKFLNKLDKQENFSLYFNTLEVLIDPTIYLVKECFENFENFRSSRYSSACYFLLSKIRKLRRIHIPIDPFFRIIKKSKINIIDHIKRIEENLDYFSFMRNFSELDLIEDI